MKHAVSPPSPPVNAAHDAHPLGRGLPGEVEDLRAEVTGLRRALQTQGVIEQAKGMLMMRFGLDADAAFALLVRLSQDHNRKVVAISAAVTDLGRRSRQLAQSVEGLERAVLGHPECAEKPAG
jgi:hypothetical protein